MPLARAQTATGSTIICADVFLPALQTGCIALSKVYFIATQHDEYAVDEYVEGSIIIDPWRYVPDQDGVSVRRIGENKPTMISVLVPSRSRPSEFARMAESIWETAIFRKRVEIIAYLDADDPQRGKYPALCAFGDEIREIQYIEGERILLSEMWNECYKRASGEILMHCGDDIVFRTPGWDQVIRKTFSESEDKILLVHGDDCSPNTDALATHGFLHRKWIDTVGYFLPPLFSSDWNDVWLTDVADMLGRRVKVPIVTEHMHYSFGKAEYDTTHQEREQRGRDDKVVELFNRTKADRKRDAELLRAVMS